MEGVWPLMHSWLTSPLLLEEKHRWKLLIASTFSSPFSLSRLCSCSGYQDHVYLKIGYRFSLNFLAWGEGGGYRKPSVAVPLPYGLGAQDRVFSWRVSWMPTLNVLCPAYSFFPCVMTGGRKLGYFPCRNRSDETALRKSLTQKIIIVFLFLKRSAFWAPRSNKACCYTNPNCQVSMQTPKVPLLKWSLHWASGEKGPDTLVLFLKEDSLRTTRKQADENRGQDLSMPICTLYPFC